MFGKKKNRNRIIIYLLIVCFIFVIFQASKPFDLDPNPELTTSHTLPYSETYTITTSDMNTNTVSVTPEVFYTSLNVLFFLFALITLTIINNKNKGRYEK